MSSLRGSSILITGGSGSFGRAFVRFALANLDPRRIIIFSRDELKQYEMRHALGGDSRLRWALGDIRERDALMRAMFGVDYVVHAAALKQVDTAEYHPYEYVKTNVVGSQNVIDAATAGGVRKVVAISTDKASSPINLYGATKMVADKLFTAADDAASSVDTRLSVVRYGNVMGSRGSVVPLFRSLAEREASLPITDKRMTRFWISLAEAVAFVVSTFDVMQGGELFVPLLPSVKIAELAEAIYPGGPTFEVGCRPGEKLHEEMIAKENSRRTFRMGDRYVVLSSTRSPDLALPHGCAPVPHDFAYRSDTNEAWLTVDDLRLMLQRGEI
ncbi:MAG TPA: UDP-N-acetylglucosamine 4,6-dehydratase (inverting) [Micromonosporaceae bacterium]|nr:UDP-N-acetylglucosamine 4,6-dehydratase (inverting) [Micromonosporaceae bacterium]